MLCGSNLILLAVTALLAVYWYSTRNFDYWKRRNVPFKAPVIFFGSFLSIIFGKESVGHFIAALCKEIEGPYFGLFALSTPFLVVKDPNLIDRIMVKDFNHFADRIFYNDEKVDPIAAHFLLGIKSPSWKMLRAKLTPIFTTGKIRMMLPLMMDCSNNMVKYLSIKTGQSIQTKDLVMKFTVDTIGTCAFGISVDSFFNENNAFITAARHLFIGKFRRYVQPLAYVFAHKLVRILRLQFLETNASNFLARVFTEAIAQRETTNVERNDLVNLLLKMKKMTKPTDDFKIDDNRLVAQAIIFFVAGFETTSSTISFTLYELALNQDVQNRLRKEIQETFALYDDLYEAIQNMKYLHMVVSETMRKYPITSFLHRECVEDYLVRETGLVIKRGDYILISQRALHWDPNNFPEPQTYNPERFSSANKSKINRCTYLPFGRGPRSCIGERFGLLNVKLGVLSIIRDFIVEPNLETKVPLAFGNGLLLHSSDGVPLTYKKIHRQDSVK